MFAFPVSSYFENRHTFNGNIGHFQIAAIQHSIVLPTSAPLTCQRKAIFDKVAGMIKRCADLNANIICLQETWSKLINLVFEN